MSIVVALQDVVDAMDMQGDEYRFRQQALEAIAIEWLEDNDIAYTRGNDRSMEA